jgi:hypothetical protein
VCACFQLNLVAAARLIDAPVLFREASGGEERLPARDAHRAIWANGDWCGPPRRR